MASDSNTDSSDHLASTIDASRKLQSRSRGWKKMHWRKKKMNKKKMKKKKKKKHGKGGKSGGGKWLLPWGKSGKSGGNSSSKSEKTSSRSNEWKPTLSPTKWSSVHKPASTSTQATTPATHPRKNRLICVHMMCSKVYPSLIQFYLIIIAPTPDPPATTTPATNPPPPASTTKATDPPREYRLDSDVCI